MWSSCCTTVLSIVFSPVVVVGWYCLFSPFSSVTCWRRNTDLYFRQNEFHNASPTRKVNSQSASHNTRHFPSASEMSCTDTFQLLKNYFRYDKFAVHECGGHISKSRANVKKQWISNKAYFHQDRQNHCFCDCRDLSLFSHHFIARDARWRWKVNLNKSSVNIDSNTIKSVNSANRYISNAHVDRHDTRITRTTRHCTTRVFEEWFNVWMVYQHAHLSLADTSHQAAPRPQNCIQYH